MTSRDRDTRPLSAEEMALWRKVARTVKSSDLDLKTAFEDALKDEGIKRSPQKSEHKPKPDLRPQPASRTGPIDRGHDRKIKRGRVEIDSRIDLHGLTQGNARHALLGHMIRAWNRGDRTVLVITGKGVNPHILDQRRYEPWDPGARDLPGVLRRALPRWLAEPDFAALVSGYASAHVRHGGAGAWYVFLKA